MVVASLAQAALEVAQATTLAAALELLALALLDWVLATTTLELATTLVLALDLDLALGPALDSELLSAVTTCNVKDVNLKSQGLTQ